MHGRVSRLVGAMRSRGGLAPVDLDRFWEDQERAIASPFGRDIPQVPLGVLMSKECVFAELGEAEDWYRLQHDAGWTAEMCRRYNDRSEKIVGRRLLDESAPDPTMQYPPVRSLHDMFEARDEWRGQSYWLRQSAHDEEELRALLDRVEARIDRDLRGFLLPPHWEAEKDRLMAAGVKPPAYRGQRGPVTLATSIYGLENLVLLINDNESLAARFSSLILRSILARARILDQESGHTPDTAPRGFSFCDDNCYALTPAMYELFAYPILHGVFGRYCHNPADDRFLHADSAMGHLLPLLGSLGLTGVNLGPTVSVTEIREHLPRAVIYGQLAPFTLSRNDEEGVVSEFLRDQECAREKRGLVFSTAGSINNGSRLTSMRLIMAATQEYGRYD